MSRLDPALPTDASSHHGTPLARDNSEIVEFGRHLAHDLNNFTAVIRSYSELLLQAMPAGTARDDVVEIHRAANAMIAYVQHVTQFSRVKATRPTWQALRPLVETAISEFAEARDAAPVAMVPGEDAQVFVDPYWFISAIRALVNNAREAAPAHTSISLRINRQEMSSVAGVLVAVRDEGPGFNSDIDARAELPFVTTKFGVRGAGFGLTVASAFAHASGGYLIRARHETATTVSIWLPVQSD